MIHVVQNGQEGITAVEMVSDESTAKCFLDHGIKLADIVTDEVVIACECVSDGPALYVCGGEQSIGQWYARVCQDTGG